MIKLSVVIPLYNEHERFKQGFDHYYTYLKTKKYPWEIILVNDGSSDDTLDLIKRGQKGKPNVSIISYTQNKGKGFAIHQGVKKAEGDYILFTDIDHSVPIETIESFFEFFKKGNDVVIGSRRVKGSVIEVHQKPLREFLGKGFTTIVNFAIYPKIADATCGFKMFNRTSAQRIFTKITIFNWAFDAEILYICRENKIKIAQAPVRWKDASGTKVSLKKDIINSLIGVVTIRLNGIKGKYRNA